MNAKFVPKIVVQQRVMLKKTHYEISCYDGYAIVEYGNEEVAKRTFDRLKEDGVTCELKGTTLKEYFPKATAFEIHKAYLRDIELAMTKNGRFMKISYNLKT